MKTSNFRLVIQKEDWQLQLVNVLSQKARNLFLAAENVSRIKFSRDSIEIQKFKSCVDSDATVSNMTWYI